MRLIKFSALILCLLIIVSAFSSILVHAETPPPDTSGQSSYQLLAPLTPGSNSTVDPKNVSGYVISIYYVVIGLAGVLAVLFIVIGGFLYISTSSSKDKDKGKAWIKNALWGLLLVLGSVIILQTINPNLLNLSNLGLNLPGVQHNIPPANFDNSPVDPGWYVRKITGDGSESNPTRHDYIGPIPGVGSLTAEQACHQMEEDVKKTNPSSWCFNVPTPAETVYECFTVFRKDGPGGTNGTVSTVKGPYTPPQCH
jgi:hypothetical protein